MVGIVFGCFCPLHQGHLDIIYRAKKENDHCIVVCCGYDSDRGKGFLELDERYRLVKEFFKDDELVHVLKINDTALGIDNEWSLHNWQPWLFELYRQIDKLNLQADKFTFYVSEENYRDELSKSFGQNVILCERTRKISGSMIRNNPLKYWDSIASTFRRIFSKNILIMGTASEGKTTLVNDIGAFFNAPHSYEAGRISVEMKTDEELEAEDFVLNIYEQNKLNKELIKSAGNKGVFLSDTDNLVTLMYAYEYAQNKKFKMSKKDYKQILLPLAKMYARNIKWNKIFVLSPHEKFVDDGVRCMEHSALSERQKLFKILIDLLHEFNYEYEILDGSYYDNFETVKKYIENLYTEEN